MCRGLAAVIMLALAVMPAGAQSAGGAFPFDPPQPGPFFDPPEPGPTAARSRFLSPRSDASYPFTHNPGRDAERVCDRLDEQGFPNLGWKTSAFGTGGECMALVAERGEGEPEPNSLFYLMRGRTGIDHVRLKINLPQTETAPATIESAGYFLDALSAALGIDVPEQVRTGVRNLQPSDFATETAYFSLSREYGLTPRYNLTLDFRPNPRRLYWVPSLGIIQGLPPSVPVEATARAPLTTSKSPRISPPRDEPVATE
jgi:hypothetical protein